VKRLERQRFATTSGPRSGGRAATRAAPAEVKRAVRERDDGRCTFVGPDGRRCNAEAFVELDHIDPRARGRRDTVDNLRLLCAAHNRYEAKNLLGADRVAAARTKDHARRSRRAALMADLIAGLTNLGFSAAKARVAARRAVSKHPEATSLQALLPSAMAILAPTA
jgi:hypothetical protein